MTPRRPLQVLALRFAALALCLPALGFAAEPPSSTLNVPSTLTEVAPQAMMPSWFANGRPTADARAALAVLRNAESHGLHPEDYQVQDFALALAQADRGSVAPATLARWDAELTAALERYLSHLHHGRLSPAELQYRFEAPPPVPFDARDFLLQARAEGRLVEALGDVEPQVPMYDALQSAMNRYRAMGDHAAWQSELPPLPQRSLKPEQSYEGLPMVAARLSALGDLPGDAALPTLTYDSALVAAVERFQRRHGLETDGIIGPATLAELAVSPAQRATQMALTLERLRWTPLRYGPRMIVVNVPEFVLRAYEVQGQRIDLDLEMNVVVGRALNTRTPVFLELMQFIEFSPYWNVPISIARGETLPRLRRDPAYFTQQGFEFVTGGGEVVRTLSDDAIAAVQRGDWRIRQRPGPQNALGDIKFIFPNDQNIYLHHTPSPQLFSRARRDFSHGCIRIEAPVALAEFVLHPQPEWTVTRIEDAMTRGESRTIRLDAPVPVLITYMTTVVKGDGTVYFFPDIYQHDTQLEQALHDARPNDS